MIMSSDREFTLWPQAGTELTIDLPHSSFTIPIVGGATGYIRALSPVGANPAVDERMRQMSDAQATGYRTLMIATLTELRTAEEVFFVDHNGYTDRIADMAQSFTVPDGVKIDSLVVSPDKNSWSAIATSTHVSNVRCGVAVGKLANPVGKNAGEGEPICK